jgi:hypothetical protein
MNKAEALCMRPGVGVTSELTLAEVLAGWDVPHSPAVKRISPPIGIRRIDPDANGIREVLKVLA